jgi:hypothetical protein
MLEDRLYVVSEEFLIKIKKGMGSGSLQRKFLAGRKGPRPA